MTSSTDAPQYPLSGPADLQDQVALVTGAARGIGQGIALALATAGANVVIFDREPARDTVAAVERLERRALYLTGDVARRTEVERAVRQAADRFGRLDILVNNAGVVERTILEELDDATFDREIDVILRGTVLCCQAVYPLMQQQRYGKIVNISSISGKLGGAVSTAPGAARGRSGPAYAAAKGGVIAFTKWLAKDAGQYGIYVNCICPGPVASEMTAGFTYHTAGQPIARLGQPADVAQAALFFASPMSNFITGQTLNVDGGILMD